MNRLIRRLRHLGHEWLKALVASLPNDVVSCRIRQRVYSFLGFDIRPGALIYRHVLLLGKVHLGEGSSVSNNSCLSGAGAGVHIGQHVMIAPNCCLVAFNHGTEPNGVPMVQQPLVEAPIVIEDDVWIGANSTITAGVTIRRGAIVAANSVVIRDVGPLEVVGGVPARLLKMRTPNA